MSTFDTRILPAPATSTVMVPVDVVPVVITTTATDAAVDRWFLDHVHGLTTLPTDLFNHFRAAAEDLKARLRALEK